MPCSAGCRWRDAKDQQLARELDAAETDDSRLDLIGAFVDLVRMDLRRGSVKKTVPVLKGGEFPPSVPLKLLTSAGAVQFGQGAGSSGDGLHSKDPKNGSRILKKLRQHFRQLVRSGSRRGGATRALPFSAQELRSSGCVLTALLHNYAHQYMDSMMHNYILGVRERFDRHKTLPLSAVCVPRNRLSRSFSSSSVLLTCLNPHCNKVSGRSTTTYLLASVSVVYSVFCKDFITFIFSSGGLTFLQPLP